MLVYKDVFKFEVPVYDVFFVEFADGKCNLYGVEADSVFIESLVGLEHLIEFSALHVGHHEVEAGVRLKQEVHAAQEGVVGSEQDVLLEQGAFDLVVFQQHVLADGLDSILLTCLHQLGQVDPSEGASAQLTLDVEVF